jgi:hypothetical protein
MGAMIHSLPMKERRTLTPESRAASAKPATPVKREIPAGMRACPTCATYISRKARACPHCGHHFCDPGGIKLSDPVHLVGLLIAAGIGLYALMHILSLFA